MNRAAKIKDIIDQRKPYSKKLIETSIFLEEFIDSLSKVEKAKAVLYRDINPEFLKRNFNEKFLGNLLAELNKKNEEVEILAQRFSRTTLNIGVIGETGAGKSTILQSLSGLLDDDIIPARAGGACTAVRSKIQNHPTQSSIKAEIEIHGSQTFLQELIIPYCIKLKLQQIPNSLDDFYSLAQELVRQEVPNNLKGTSLEQLYKHFVEDYCHTVPKYSQFLTSADPTKKTIQADEIQQWVTQERDEKGALTKFNHLVVRQAEIFCRFKDATTGDFIQDKITLVDIPGMGDTRLGDEELMLETLGKDVDAVLYLFRPDSQRYLWKKYDDSLYYKAKSALNNFEDRTFILLNEEGNNSNACHKLKHSPRFPVKGHEIVNCANPVEVYKVFNVVLDYLESSIVSLDQKYTEIKKKEILDILKRIINILTEYHDILNHFSDEQEQFDHLFVGKNEHGGLWGEMTASLGQYKREQKNLNNQDDENFKSKVETLIDECSKFEFPSVEDIEKQSDAVKGNLPQIGSEYLTEMRTYISKKFIQLDINLQDSLEKIKVDISKHLADSGKLNSLSSSYGADFFRDICEQLPEDNNDLWFAFNYIKEYNVSFAGLINRKIRSCLEELYPNENSVADFRDANNIFKNLQEIHKTVLEKCRKSLQEFYQLPNQIAYVMIEEFTDRIFYAHDVKSKWRSFLWKNRYTIFEELKDIGQFEEHKKKWNIMINHAVQKCNDAISMVEKSM